MASTRRESITTMPRRGPDTPLEVRYITREMHKLSLSSAAAAFRQEKLSPVKEPGMLHIRRPLQALHQPRAGRITKAVRVVPTGSLLKSKPRRGKKTQPSPTEDDGQQGQEPQQDKRQDMLNSLDLFATNNVDSNQYRIVYPLDKIQVDKRVPTIAAFLRRQEQSPEWAGKGLACYNCLNVKPYDHFADAQMHGRRGPLGTEQHLRYCIPCGVRYSKYQPGSLIRAGDRTCAVCRGCNKAHTVWCAHCGLCAGCRSRPFQSSCTWELACIQHGGGDDL